LLEPHPAQTTALTAQRAVAKMLARRAGPNPRALLHPAELAEPAAFRLVIVASEFISNALEIHAACHPLEHREHPSI
jgi:hypothetical protein